MNLQDILLLGNDMIIPRDIRDWGVYMGSEPQVLQERQKKSILFELQPSGHCCKGYWCTGHERACDAIQGDSDG